MRAAFLIIFLLCFFSGFAQVKKDTYPNVVYYIDSVRVKSLSDISPDNISGIMTVRTIDSVNKTTGEVYISSKKRAYHFMNIEELTKRVIPASDSNTRSIIYFINDKLVTDTTGMKFSYMLDVEVIDGSQIKAFKGPLSNVIILKISNTDNIPIHIRGNSALTSSKQ